MVGDTASLDQDGKPLAGVAQVAMQQGRYAGKLIRRQRRRQESVRNRFAISTKATWLWSAKGRPFCKAAKFACMVSSRGWRGLSFTSCFWLSSVSKISVFLQWGWLFLTGQRGSRLIVNYQQSEPAQTTPPTAATPNQGAQPARLESTLTK